MKKLLAALVAAMGVAAAAPAVAQDEGGVSVAVTGGTLGIGPEVGYRISNNFGVRANATFFGISHDAESDGIEYQGDLDLQSYGAMIDLYPFGGNFRLSAGARINNNKVDLVGQAADGDDTIEIGDEEYDASDVGVVNGRVETDDLAPTLTLGWGGGLTPGLKFGIDAGVMFQGSPKVTQLSTTGTDPDIQDEVNASLAEERVEIEDDIDDFKLYPVLQLSIGYRF